MSIDVFKIERAMFNCPELDCSDYNRFPLLDENRFATMRKEVHSDSDFTRIPVYIYVRGNNGERFIEVYIWDKWLNPETYARFGLYDESLHVLKLYVPDDYQKMVDNCEVDKLTGVFVTDD